jgi:N-acyl-D-aspartate/D-glutamate deacylase
MAHDLLITNGTIYDGSGAPGFRGNVAVEGGKIVGVGAVSGPAKQTLNADGLAVVPGFVDVHTHYDAQVFWDSLLTSSCWHGVTTTVMGNCGLTFAPCKPDHRELLMQVFSRVEGLSIEVLQKGLPWDWTTFPEYIDAVERQRPALNLIPLMGHSAIRTYVMGKDAFEREAAPAEIEQMQELVRTGMRAGACGLSVSRSPAQVGSHGEPMPGKVASHAELFALCDTVAEFKRGFFEINPKILIIDKDNKEREEDWQMLRTIAQRTKLPTTWAGVLQQWDQPGLWREMLDKTDQALKEGLPIYPQVSCRAIMFRFTLENIATLFDDLPHWKQVNFEPLEKRKHLFRDPEIRKGLRYDVVDDTLPRVFSKRWDLMYVQEAQLEKNKKLEKKSITEIARAMEKDVFDTFLDLALEEDLKTSFITPLINGEEDAVRTIIQHPASLVSLSDGGAHVQYICDTGYPSHMLGYWVRDQQALTMEKAIQVLAATPARVLGLTDRGQIAPGKVADLVVFDPATIRALEPVTVRDLPGGNPRLFQGAEGIHHTIVNGTPLTKDGKHLGSYPGRVLRGAGPRV